MEKLVICNCKDWKENLPKLNKPWGLYVAHGGDGYDGKQFIYCPWCGKKIREEKFSKE